jgi:zinc protease
MRKTPSRLHSHIAPLLLPIMVLGACATSPRATPDQQQPDTSVAQRVHNTPPTLAPPPELRLPPIHTRQLPNGLRLMVVERPGLPLAQFTMLVRTGGEADPANMPGVAGLTSALLREGTTTRSSLEISDQSAYLGVQLSTSSAWDASTISLNAPTAQLDSALALFADVILNPAFPADELERQRAQRLTSLTQMRDQPTAIADRAYASIVYGDDHPYGRPLAGTEPAVRALTREQLRSFYRSYYRPNNATLIVVGDVRIADIERRVQQLFGGWQRGTVPTVRFTDPPASPRTTVYLIDKPGAAQSSFRIGAVGVPRSTEDFFAIMVMNTILGGSFTSRLNQNLRETRGYTYGAGSGFAMRRAAGPFTARGEIVSAKTDSALIEFMNELRAIRDTIPADELQRARQYLQLQLPGEFETTRGIASQLVPLALYDLPLDFYDSYIQRIAAVTREDVARVARRYVDPERMAVVIVGDRASIEPGLRALGVAEVQLRDPDGRPIRRN